MSAANRKPDVSALEEMGDIEGLSEALASKDARVRLKALGALGKLKALDPLIEALQDTEGRDRALVAHYIGQIEINSHHSQATIPLTQVLQDDHQTTRHNAAEALQLIGDSRALEPLKQAYRKERKLTVRRVLKRAIKRLQ